ncbi:MAG TPA: DUF924 family protein [Caulobacteraceae bacterium]|nr:DUF924 family protein [Caulobacteraceae bacterium]
MPAHPADIVGFWTSAGSGKWFKKSDAFDDALRLRFEPVHHAAARGEHAGWAESSEGSLALVLLFDQIPRNIFRGSAHAFATDPLARRSARAMLEAGYDRAVALELRCFCYMPFMHSEDLADQDRSISLFEALESAGGPSNVDYATSHRDIIRRFGRFPHRNGALGRTTAPEEQAFLDDGGFSG